MTSETDYDALRRILTGVVPLEETPQMDLLTSKFPSGDTLSFCCDATGKLKLVVIQPPLPPA